MSDQIFKDFQPFEFKEFGWIRLPEIHLEEKHIKQFGFNKKPTNQIFFETIVRKAFNEKKSKFNQNRLKEYEDRLTKELGLFEELGFTDYCLLVWQVIEKAKEFGAFIDYGRGSMGASLCFYVLDITGADPIENNLIFERFVNRARSKKKEMDGETFLFGELAPDCDLNLSTTREKVREWLEKLYPNRISKIATFSTFTGKILIKDVYKTLAEVNEDEAKRVADLVEKHQGIVEDIEKMPEKNEEFKVWSEKHKDCFDVALSLRDLLRQQSSHASGYLVSFFPLEGFVPLELNKENELCCGFGKDDAAMFAIKLDLLGLIQNQILKEIEPQIPEKYSEINLANNPIVYDQFQTGTLLPYGLYQISADVAYRVLSKVKAKNLSELSDVSAMARPGALAYVDDYTNHTAKCPHPAFEEILRPTRYLCLYQEQMLMMAVKIGFTNEEAEQLRRVVGKKKIDEVKLWKDRIYKKAEQNGFEKNIGDILWKILEDSSKYSFNACLSPDTVVETKDGQKLLYEVSIGDMVKAFDVTKQTDHFVKVVNKHENYVELYEVELDDGRKIKCSLDHKFLTQNNGMQPLRQILAKKLKMVTD